jgi:hypothetical protein
MKMIDGKIMLMFMMMINRNFIVKITDGKIDDSPTSYNGYYRRKRKRKS